MPRCLCISPCHALLGPLVSLPLLVCNITFSPLSSKYFQKNSVHFNIKKNKLCWAILDVCLACGIFLPNISDSSSFSIHRTFSCASLDSKNKFMAFALKSRFQICVFKCQQYRCFSLFQRKWRYNLILDFLGKFIWKPCKGTVVHPATGGKQSCTNSSSAWNKAVFFSSFQFIWLCNLGRFATNQGPEHWRSLFDVFWVTLLASHRLEIWL